MKNYEDLILERVQFLTGKLAQKQREGNLTEELGLCVRLAQLHFQLDSPKVALQFWQSCIQIAADLGDEEEGWRSGAEISKIYSKFGQIEEAESFMNLHLTSNDPARRPLRLSLLQAEVIKSIGESHHYNSHNKQDELFLSVNEFKAYERALKVIDEAFEGTSPQNIWWWDAVAFRAELLALLGKFEESRYSEAIETLQTIINNNSRSSNNNNNNNENSDNVLMSLRTKSISAQIYFEMGEFRTSLDFATSVIDQYKSDPENSNYRPRRRFYCEMLILAGRALKKQKDFNFSLDNLLLAKEEAQALTVEKELMETIDRATQETLLAKEATIKLSQLQRKKTPSPIDLEEISDTHGIIGDYNRQAEILEECREIALNESTQRRLDKKLFNLYAFELRNWRGIQRKFTEENYLFKNNCKNLIILGKGYEKLGLFEDAERVFLRALNETREDEEEEIICNSALFFFYRLRGRISLSEKYEQESQSLERILKMSKLKTPFISIDPNFSYFATRKPSNSLMKMVGSGMVMRTRTKKTAGLELKKRRGPNKLGVKRKERRVVVEENVVDEGNFGYSSDDLSDFDFIVSESESELDSDNDNVNDNDNDNDKVMIISNDKTNIQSSKLSKSFKSSKSLKSSKTQKSFVIYSSDESEPETFKNNKTPLTVTEPVSLISSPNPSAQSSAPFKIDFDRVSKVIVRIKKGLEVLIPVNSSCTVSNLIQSAQTRFMSLFPSEMKELGTMSGLGLISSTSNASNAMLFHDDLIASIVSKDLEIIQAYFTSDSSLAKFDSPSKFVSIEEEFKRKIQILNFKKDSQEEISWLKGLQERFNTGRNGKLDLSSLSIDSSLLNDNVPLINKLVRNVPLLSVNLKENLLCDDDLKMFNFKQVHSLNLSLNFLQKPTALKSLLSLENVDLSYNPIDLDWLGSNATFITRNSLNLIGCFDIVNNNAKWKELGKTLRFVKKIQISLPTHSETQNSFISGLCESTNSSEIEEIIFFATDFRDAEESLLELSYVETLKYLSFECCTFRNKVLETLSKVLKRSTKLEKMKFHENDVEESNLNGMEIFREFGSLVIK